MNLLPIADYLKLQYPMLPIFVHHMPETVETGVLLRIDLPGAKCYPEIPNYRRGDFLMVIRDADPGKGYRLASEIAKLLTWRGPRALDRTFKVMQCVPLRDPIPYPETAGDYIEFAVEFRIHFVDES
ncbi:minor capsid protein [Methylocaldum szegediense]|uniref:minor capsid protein n=1 Tax=Methylocaldum szegediense TaxID=73780 RepID=UPI00041CC0EB|nr:minor capsid protein [Methylocaldum szegediense]